MEFVYKGDIYTTAPKEGQGTNAHNTVYRGLSLGSFTSGYDQSTQDGTFNNMYVGDTFTMNNHNYTIAGFNYEFGKDHNKDLGNHILMLTDPMLIGKPMDTSNTTSGGFANTDMFKNQFQTIISQLQTDWGNHLLTFADYLSTSTDGNGKIINATWYNTQASLPNAMMWSGKSDTANADNDQFNNGIDSTQMPIMQLHPDEQKGGSYWLWLRDVYDATSFAIANYDGSLGHRIASAYYGNGDYYRNCAVRAFFLIA